MEFDLFYDYLCPYVYRAAVLLENVIASGERELKINWRYFSLMQVNSDLEGWTVWDAPDDEPVKGRLAFSAAEAARRQGRLDAIHMPLLHGRARAEFDINDRAAIDRIARDAGLDMDRFAQDMLDPTIIDALARDHQEAVAEHGVFGTPTFLFANREAAYLRLSEPPAAHDSVRIFDEVVAVAASEPKILEIKRPNRPHPG